MTELEAWVLLFLLLCAGIGLTRFNPAMLYSRRSVFWVAALVIGVALAVLLVGFDTTPQPTLSGILDED